MCCAVWSPSCAGVWRCKLIFQRGSCKYLVNHTNHIVAFYGVLNRVLSNHILHGHTDIFSAWESLT
jgi:hypothetical protein